MLAYVFMIQIVCAQGSVGKRFLIYDLKWTS